MSMSQRSIAAYTTRRPYDSTPFRSHARSEMEKRLRWQWRRPRSGSWRVDETYVKVRGKWAYLYRAVDKFGDTIDFYLSATRNTKAAKRFLGKALRGLKDWELPEVVNNRAGVVANDGGPPAHGACALGGARSTRELSLQLPPNHAHHPRCDW